MKQYDCITVDSLHFRVQVTVRSYLFGFKIGETVFVSPFGGGSGWYRIPDMHRVVDDEHLDEAHRRATFDESRV
jgi:hypothetical protein